MTPSRMLTAAAAVLAMMAVPAGADDGRAVSLKEAKALLWQAEPAALETAFAGHREAFVEGAITADAFTAPFDAFRVWHAPHHATIDAWVAAYPESPAAATARGAAFEEVALVEQDTREIDELPPERVLVVIEATRKAAASYARALELSAHQVYAAMRILDADPRVLVPGMADAAAATLDTHGSPLLPLRLAVERQRPDDTGYADEVLGLCEDAIPRVEGLTLEQCLAFALRDHTVSVVKKARYLMILEADEAQRFPRAIYDLISTIKGRGAATDFALAAGIHFNDDEVWTGTDEMFQQSLAHDPTDPLMRGFRAMKYSSAGDYTRALATITVVKEEARQLSSLWRMEEAILVEAGRFDLMLDWFERALAEPGLDPYAWVNPASRYLRSVDERILQGADGTLHPDAACRVHAVVMALRDGCARAPVTHGTCMPRSLDQAEERAAPLGEGCAD
ncbi:MAG: DUF4034 domain-containing protein [Pseudomonadota bacterium]